MANVTGWDINFTTNVITVRFDANYTAPAQVPANSLYLVPSNTSTVTTYDLVGCTAAQLTSSSWTITMSGLLVNKIKAQTVDFISSGTTASGTLLRSLSPFVDANAYTLVTTYTSDTNRPTVIGFDYAIGNTAQWNMAIRTVEPILSNTFVPNRVNVFNSLANAQLNNGTGRFTLTGGNVWLSNGVTYLKFTQTDYTSVQAIWVNAASNSNSVYASFAANLGNNWIGTTANANGNIRVSNVIPGILPAGYKLQQTQDFQILGGNAGQALLTDGTGNMYYGTPVTPAIANGNSNINITTANGSINFSASGNANILRVTGNGLISTLPANVTELAALSGNANGSLYLYLQNYSNGNSATTDLTASSDAGTATQGYVDIGITSSTYSNASFPILGKQDSYVFAVGNTSGNSYYSPGNLVLGAFTDANSRLKLGAGSSYSNTNILMTLGNNAVQMNVPNISLGANTGNGQGTRAVAIGSNAASNSQGAGAIAIGNNAAVGNSTRGQGVGSIAIGDQAVGNRLSNTQGQYATAVGNGAAFNGQGDYAVAIGYQAGYTGQPANTIIISANGESGLNITSVEPGLYIKPIRGSLSAGRTVFYDPDSGEVTYSTALGSVASEISVGNTIMQVTSAGGPIQTDVGGEGSNVFYISNTAVSVNEDFNVSGNSYLGNIFINDRPLTGNSYGISSNLIYLETASNISIQGGVANTFLMTDGNGHLSWANPTINANVQAVAAIAEFTFSGNTATGNGTTSNAQPELIDWTFSSNYSANAGAQVWGQGSFSTGANSSTTNTSIRYLNGQYVATRSDGTIVTSADGQTWSAPTTVSLVAGDILTDINYGGTVNGGAGASYVISTTRSYPTSGTSADVVWYISQDLVTWTRKTLVTITTSAANTEVGTRSVSYANVNGQFVWLMTAVYNGRLYIYKTNDLINWAVTGLVGGYVHTAGINTTAGKVTYGGGGWVVNTYVTANPSSSSDPGGIVWSSDSSNWTYYTSGVSSSSYYTGGYYTSFGGYRTSSYFIAVGYINGFWFGYSNGIATCPYGTLSRPALYYGTSPDVSTWTFYGTYSFNSDTYYFWWGGSLNSWVVGPSFSIGTVNNATFSYDPVTATYFMYSDSSTSFGLSTQNPIPVGNASAWTTTLGGAPGFTPYSMTNRRTFGGFLVVGSPPSPNPSSAGGTGKLVTFSSSRTTYQISLPFSSYTSNGNTYTYSATTFTWTPSIGANYIAVASSLGNAITSVRPTWTATYPSNGVARLNTNFNEDLATITTTNLTAPPTGTLTQTVAQQGSAGIGGSQDVITITDNLTLQQFIYVPPFNQSVANVCNGIAITSDLSSWVVTVGANNNSIILTQRYPGFISYSSMPTANIIQGSNSTLAVNRSSVNQGQATLSVVDTDFRDSPGNVFATDGTANSAWANYVNSQVYPGGSNTYVQYRDANGKFAGSNSFTFNYANNIINVASNANSYTTIGNAITTTGGFSGGGNITTTSGNISTSNGALSVTGNITTSNGGVTANGNITTTANFVITGGGLKLTANANIVLTANNGNTTTLRANANVSGNYSLAWPNTGGLNGQVLTSDGLGNLVWVTTSSTTGSYSISNGNASVTTFGPDANVALTAGNTANANQILLTSNVTYFNSNVRIRTTEIALGNLAGNATQSTGAIAIGNSAAQGNASTGQGNSAIAIGDQAAGNPSGSVQAANAIAIGFQAGYSAQGVNSIAVGALAGNSSQGTDAVAIGTTAGQTSQGANAIAIGRSAGNTQSANAVAIGASAGTNQAAGAVSIGYTAGQTGQGSNAISVGWASGQTNQSSNAVSIGYQAGFTTQGSNAVSIGYLAGNASQQSYAIAIGSGSAVNTQGGNSIAIGREAAGNTGVSQGANAISIGYQAGYTSQGANSIAVGLNSARSPQGAAAISIGNAAAYGNGSSGQGASAIAIGNQSAGNTSGNTQGANAIAIGFQAGYSAQGVNSIAIGALAGVNAQPNNSIVLNASGSTLNANAAGLYINPIRLDNTNSANVIFYNTTTKETTYSPAYGTVLPYRFTGNTQSYFDIASQSQIQAVLPTFPTPKDGDYFVDTNTSTNNQQPIYLYVNGLWRQIFTAFNI